MDRITIQLMALVFCYGTAMLLGIDVIKVIAFFALFLTMDTRYAVATHQVALKQMMDILSNTKQEKENKRESN